MSEQNKLITQQISYSFLEGEGDRSDEGKKVVPVVTCVWKKLIGIYISMNADFKHVMIMWYYVRQI